jgi:hypothetical protein
MPIDEMPKLHNGKIRKGSKFFSPKKLLLVQVALNWRNEYALEQKFHLWQLQYLTLTGRPLFLLIQTVSFPREGDSICI